MGIVLKFSGTSKNRPASVRRREGRCESAVSDILRDLEHIHSSVRSGGAFDFEVVAVIGVEFQKSANNQRVDGHPDRSAPVRISAEHARV